MDSHDGRYRGLFSFKRVVSLIVLVSCFFNSLPSSGFCDLHLSDLNNEAFGESEIQAILLSKISEMKKSFISCENRNLEALKSIQLLIDEIALNYNIALSLTDVLEASKTRLSTIDLHGEARAVLDQVIHNFEITHSASTQTITEWVVESVPITLTSHSKDFEIFGYGIYPPWKWNWFGYNKNDKKHENRNQYVRKQMTYPGPIPPDDGSIPDDLIICGVEAFVICILLLIPSGYTQLLAAGIAYDMGSRALDGVKEMSERNRELQRDSHPHSF